MSGKASSLPSLSPSRPHFVNGCLLQSPSIITVVTSSIPSYPNPLISCPRHHRLLVGGHLPPQPCHVTAAPTTPTSSLTSRPPSLIGKGLLSRVLKRNLTRALVGVGDHNSSMTNGGGTKTGHSKPLNHLTFRPCLDIDGFILIHVYWCGLGWNLIQVPLQSTSTHVD